MFENKLSTPEAQEKQQKSIWYINDLIKEVNNLSHKLLIGSLTKVVHVIMGPLISDDTMIKDFSFKASQLFLPSINPQDPYKL
jgi:hypothetical protein